MPPDRFATAKELDAALQAERLVTIAEEYGLGTFGLCDGLIIW